jgi:hypothetical protein
MPHRELGMNPHGLITLLRRLIRSKQADRDLDDEIEAHLAIETRQREEAGETAEQAWLSARKLRQCADDQGGDTENVGFHLARTHRAGLPVRYPNPEQV